jgi:hypothetical protein
MFATQKPSLRMGDKGMLPATDFFRGGFHYYPGLS